MPAATLPSLTPLYPDSAAFDMAAFDVQGHMLQVAQHGRADGIPALVLHGGPGCGRSPLHRSFFPARAEDIDAYFAPLATVATQAGASAGDDPSHPAMAAAMVEALDHWAAHGDFVGAP